jgi:hypothetical protein
VVTDPTSNPDEKRGVVELKPPSSGRRTDLIM